MSEITIDPIDTKKPVLDARDAEAIALFKQGMEKESSGKMSDAVEYYRKAFKVNEKVDLLYRQVEVPLKVQQMKDSHGHNATVKVDEAKVKAIDVEKLLKSFEHIEARAPGPEDLTDGMVIKFANLGVDNHEQVVTKPMSPLIHLHNEIWLHILEILLVSSPESWINLSITCKKFAFLGLSTSDIWRKLCYLVYPVQNYEENLQMVAGFETGDAPDTILPVPKDQLLILPSYDSWKHMIDQRPFIKFGGCYISVINYYSEGGNTIFTNRWTNPIRVITYYRYLRFYPDGTCIKVLSALEPYKVVPQLSKYNLSRNITSLVDQVKVAAHHSSVKEHHRIYHGTWSISTAGEVHVAIHDGSVPYYQFHYHFEIKSISRVFKYSRLNWVRYYTIRKQMEDDDDRVGEVSDLSIRNEKPFKFSRVKSYDVNTW